jgi:hypothetical protein
MAGSSARGLRREGSQHAGGSPFFGSFNICEAKETGLLPGNPAVLPLSFIPRYRMGNDSPYVYAHRANMRNVMMRGDHCE